MFTRETSRQQRLEAAQPNPPMPSPPRHRPTATHVTVCPHKAVCLSMYYKYKCTRLISSFRFVRLFLLCKIPAWQEEEEEFEVDIENYDCPLREWITRERTKLEIRKKFSRFLRKFTLRDNGELVYRKRIREMCVSNRQSLEVSIYPPPRSFPPPPSLLFFSISGSALNLRFEPREVQKHVCAWFQPPKLDTHTVM